MLLLVSNWPTLVHEMTKNSENHAFGTRIGHKKLNRVKEHFSVNYQAFAQLIAHIADKQRFHCLHLSN